MSRFRILSLERETIVGYPFCFLTRDPDPIVSFQNITLHESPKSIPIFSQINIRKCGARFSTPLIYTARHRRSDRNGERREQTATSCPTRQDTQNIFLTRRTKLLRWANLDRGLIEKKEIGIGWAKVWMYSSLRSQSQFRLWLVPFSDFPYCLSARHSHCHRHHHHFHFISFCLVFCALFPESRYLIKNAEHCGNERWRGVAEEVLHSKSAL